MKVPPMSVEPAEPVDDVFVDVPSWEPDTVAIGVVSTAGTYATYGPLDAVLPLASITKPLTSYAIHLAAQAGQVSLSEPVPSTEAKGEITLTHLLAHASGLPIEDAGIVIQPERKRVYSNPGYDLAARFVAERLGMPFADVLDQLVFTPLGMTDTSLHGSAARDATGTVADLMRFARELLEPTLLDPDVLRRARSDTFPGLSGVMPGFGRHDPLPWGVGFEVFAHKSPHWLDASLPAESFGHFGRDGGFLFVCPNHDLAAVSLSDAPFDDWARAAWPPFSAAVFSRFAQPSR